MSPKSLHPLTHEILSKLTVSEKVKLGRYQKPQPSNWKGKIDVMVYFIIMLMYYDAQL